MKLRMDYGKGGIWLEFPEKVFVVGKLDVKSLENPEERLMESLRHPVDSPPLRDLAVGRKRACIVISDNTRPVPNEFLLNGIISEIEDEVERIDILIANGIHEKLNETAIEELVGSEIAAKYRVINHDAFDMENLEFLGKTERDLPIYVNKIYLTADLKILTGLIEPHFMAGYSGGRKSICPGISGYETVKYFHSPMLLESPRSDNCIIEGNPVHEEATFIEERKPERKGYIGPSTLESLKRILEGEKPEKAGFGKTTCGSAMRILAVAFCSGRLNENELMGIIHSTCIPTHNTNIALESSLTLGMAYHMLISGCDLNDIMDGIKNIPEMMERIDVPRFVGASTVDRILNLAEFSSRIRSDEDFLDFLYGVVGTTMEANEVVPVSFLIFLRSGDDVWKAIRLGASVGGDTDTISAIAGALSTLYAKDHNIPKATVDEVVERNGLNLERYTVMIEKIWNV